MKSTTFILYLGLLLGAACQQKPAETPATANIFSTTYAIRPSQIFKPDVLLGFAKSKTADSLQLMLNEAKTHYQKAVALEKENPKQATHWYHKVLTCYPSTSTYLKLGDLLLAAHEIEDAKYAYQTALFVHQEEVVNELSKKFDAALQLAPPKKEDIYSKTLKATVLNQNFEEAVYLLTENYESGYLSKDFILNDASLKTLRENPAFKLFYAINLTSGEQKVQARREYFLEQFGKATLPYTLAVKPPKITQYAEYEYYEGGINNTILQKYEKEIIADSQRYASVTYLVKLNSTPNYDLLLATYDTTSLASVTEEFRTFNYVLFSLDKQGNITDKTTVAYRSPFAEASCTIMASEVVMQVAERTWKNPNYYQAGKNNELVTTKPTKTQKYQIDEKGNFLEQKTE